MSVRSPWVAVVVLLGCAAAHPVPLPEAAPAAVAGPEEPLPALQLPPDVRPTRYRLELTIDPRQPRFSGTVEIDLALEQPRQVLWLHGRDLELGAASVQAGEAVLPARAEQMNDDGVLRLRLPRPVGPGPATLRLAWSQAFDPQVVGLSLAREGGEVYAFSQFESFYARRAFPCFDEPRFKTPFEVTLVVPEGDVAVANTAPVSSSPAGPGLKRLRHAPTRPLPTYLLAWAVGPFDVVDAPPIPPSPVRSWPVPLRGIAPRGRGGELAFGLEASRELLLREEAYFGIPYPFPKLDAVAVPDFAAGAMENAGEIHYREDAFLVKEGQTSEEAKQGVASIVAHEQAHQWFGDLVTMPWWTDAWLNEAFATWLAARMVEDWRPGYHAALDLQKSFAWAMDRDALVSARAIREPVKDMKSVDNQFDVLTYQKGGGVLAMFERALGPEVFRRGVTGYLAAHADGSGSTADLLAALSRAAGREVEPAFRTFLDQSGVPLVQATVTCDTHPRLTLRQSRYLPLGSTGTQDRRWRLPVCFRFGTGGGARERCVELEQAEATVELPGCPGWVMPNAHGAGYYRWTLPGEDLKRLVGAGYARLEVAERVNLAENLRAAVLAGALSAADALGAVAPLASDPEGEVASEPIRLLEFLRLKVLGPEAQPAARAYLAKLYGPVLRRLGLQARTAEGASARRLRVAVADLLVEAEDPATVREVARLGLAYAGLADGRFHPEAVDPDLADVALKAAVQQGGRPVFEALRARLETEDDGVVRERILLALGSVRDPERSAAALALALDPRLRLQEGLLPVFYQAWEPRTAEPAWRFAQEHFEVLVKKAPPTWSSSLPFVARGTCRASRADEVASFFAGRAAAHDGMAKNAQQAEEMIRLCAAQADAQRESARRFLAAPPAPSLPAPRGR